MPFARPTIKEIQTRIMADMSTLLLDGRPVQRKSFLSVLAKAFSKAVYPCYGFLAWIVKQMFASTAETKYLEIIGEEIDVTRRPAGYASGEAIFTGIDGAAIPAGTMLNAANGQQYRTSELGTIGFAITEQAIIPVEAVVEGAAGNIDAGEILSLVSPIESVYSAVAVNTGSIDGGTDIETDAELLARILAKKRRPPQGGAVPDYEQWMMAVPGVYRPFVFTLYGGPGTDPDVEQAGFVAMSFCVATGDHIPSGTKVSEVQVAIDTVRSNTVKGAVVFAPTPLPVALEIQVTPNTQAVQDAVEAALDAMLLAEAVPTGTSLPGGAVASGKLYLSHINEAISLAVGEIDHVLVSPTSDITIRKDEFPVLSYTW
jgi:uncharacterized phage protein gp47/JayE